MTLPKKPNQAEMDAANGAQLDPIIDALLEHLPAPGDYWAQDDRKRWLAMIELAFDMIYDDNETPPEATDAPVGPIRQHGG
jgi:hypothetical protein